MKFFGLLATALAAPAVPAAGDGVCLTGFLQLMKDCSEVQVIINFVLFFVPIIECT